MSSPLLSRTSSAASICHTSCGQVARWSLQAGRRPGGAAGSPWRWNHRCRVRSLGKRARACFCRSITRMKPAPQLGCCWRNVHPSCTSRGGSTHAGRPQRSYAGMMAAGPAIRTCCKMRRTVRTSTWRAWAMESGSWPCRSRRTMACRKATGMARDIGNPPCMTKKLLDTQLV